MAKNQTLTTSKTCIINHLGFLLLFCVAIVRSNFIDVLWHRFAANYSMFNHLLKVSVTQ